MAGGRGIAVTLLLPDGARRSVEVTSGAGKSLADLLHEVGFGLNTRCGQRGLCDGCVVEILPVEGVAGGAVRACERQAATCGGAIVRIPLRSLQRHAPHIVTDFRVDVPVGHDPPDPCGDGAVGAAVDVGTTTVVLLLVDMRDGRILATEAGLNRQIRFGEDVLTRIDCCGRDPEKVRSQRDAIVHETIMPLLKQAAESAGVGLDRLACMSVVGNTTMLHLLAGMDPSPMGTAPFTPVFLEHTVLSESNLKDAGIAGPVHLLPGCAAYVGADIAGGIFASGLLYDDRPSLLVDLGTNGEIVLQHDHKLYACATAAGPAFEGVGLECGMRAGAGAISRLRITSASPLKVEHEVLGAAQKPVGICGSGYVDFLAEGRRVGLLTPAGRFDRAAVDVQTLRRRLSTGKDGLAVPVLPETSHANVVISEGDVARLLQAKAAIAAGIVILLRRLDLRPSDVSRVCLAGGFGMHVDVSNSIRCGLLPDFEPEQVQVIGNSSLAGAYLALLDRAVIDELEQIRRQVEVIELNQDEQFESCYIDQLALP